MSNYKEKLKHITTFIFDYDGVLTDGKVILLNDDEGLRTAHVKDGYAMQYAIKKGYRVAIISGGRSEAINRRFKVLDVHDVFMGDDIPDYPLMKQAGIATCPANASEEIKSVAAYISSLNGGDGCVRDVIEQVLKVQGKWFDKQTAFLW